MTKKDYELFANEINKRYNERNNVEAEVTLCEYVFKQDNLLFNPEKFERACYEGKHIRKAIKTA